MTYRQLLSSNADFRRLWSGQVISEIGDWLSSIAVLALTIQLAGPGREGLAVAIYAIARHLPLFLFGPVAGVVVDRADRRRVMIAADIVRALFTLGFLFATRFESVGVIYAVAAAVFSVSAFFNAAKRATIPNLTVGTQELLTANSLSASTTAATIAVGSALGGLAAATLGRDAVFILNAISFLLSADMIRRIRWRRPSDEKSKRAGEIGVTVEGDMSVEDGGRGIEAAGMRATSVSFQGHAAATRELLRCRSRLYSTLDAPRLLSSVLARVWNDFHDGLRHVRRDPVLSALFIVAAGWGLGNGAARALYSIFGAQLGVEAVSTWGEHARSFIERPTDFGISVLFVAMGVGGVMGAPLARRFSSAGGPGLGARMGRSLVFDGCGLALFSLMPNLWTAALVLVGRELNFAIWWTAQQTIMMKRTADAYAGRVFASFETLTTLSMVGAIFAAGAAADSAGIRPVALGGGAVVILSGLMWFVLRRRGASFTGGATSRADDGRHTTGGDETLPARDES